MLYYGSAFLAAGSILFAWRCPEEIKRYASPFLLVDTERPHLTAHSQSPQIADKLKALYNGMSKWETSIFKRPRLKPDHPNLGAGTEPELLTADAWGLGLIHIWEVSDIKRPIWRIIVFLLFSAGLVLLAVPALTTFLQVTRFVVKRLFT